MGHEEGFGGLDLIVECVKLQELAEEVEILAFQDSAIGCQETQADILLSPDFIVGFEEHLGLLLVGHCYFLHPVRALNGGF